MRQDLENLVKTTNPRVLGQTLKSQKNKELLSWIMVESSVLHDCTLTERVYYIINNKPNPYCDKGNKKTFSKKKNTYGFCDNISKCACFQAHAKTNWTPRDMKVVAEKRKETWLKKYGVENISQSVEVQEKRKKTLEKTDHSILYKRLAQDKQDRGFAQVIERLEKIVTPVFTIEDYNGSSRDNRYLWKCNECSHIFDDHVDYGRVPRCPICYPISKSIEEQCISDYIVSLGFKVSRNNRAIIKGIELDILIEEKNIAIEYNGVYWHSSLKKKKNYHYEKYKICKANGIRLIQIFEDEWLRSPEIIKSRLANILGTAPRTYARSYKIKKVASNQYREFVNTHHLQGYAPASIIYGLWDSDDKLQAVMSFGKARYEKEGYELLRYCSVDTIVGGASKLFKHFLKIHSPSKIISYSNRCWGEGNLYTHMGFTSVENKVIGYWYIKNNQRFHRSCFTKKSLVAKGQNSNLSEFQIMDNLGYLRIYDCGNNKYIWKE